MIPTIILAVSLSKQSLASICGESFTDLYFWKLRECMYSGPRVQFVTSDYSRDVTGVEIAGALKNVLAIAAGIVEGMNLGNNSMAALVAQGCSEIRWLATKVFHLFCDIWRAFSCSDSNIVCVLFLLGRVVSCFLFILYLVLRISWEN